MKDTRVSHGIHLLSYNKRLIRNLTQSFHLLSEYCTNKLSWVQTNSGRRQMKSKLHFYCLSTKLLVHAQKISIRRLIQKNAIIFLSKPSKTDIGPMPWNLYLRILTAALWDGYGKRGFNCAWNKSPRAPRTSICSKQRIISSTHKVSFLNNTHQLCSE